VTFFRIGTDKMSNKIKIVITMIVMLSLAGSTQAYTYSWCSSSGNWADAARWDVKPSPAVAGMALIYNGAVLDVTTAGQGCWDLALGYVPGGATVNVAAGIQWDVAGSGMVGHDGGVGVLNVYGIANFAGLRVSTNSAGSGTINVYNGGILKAGVGGWAVNVGELGTANINLKGNGSMEVGGDGGFHLSMNGHGHIDIEAGQLKVLGDYHTQLQGYVNNGWITSHGGANTHCSPVVSFVDGYTYVKTTGCTCVTYLPADLNHDCYVDMLDLASLAQQWLVCTISSDPNCVQ
jgi:hypothetical protein